MSFCEGCPSAIFIETWDRHNFLINHLYYISHLKDFSPIWTFTCQFKVFFLKISFLTNPKPKINNTKYFKLNINKALYLIIKINKFSCDFSLPSLRVCISDASSICKAENIKLVCYKTFNKKILNFKTHSMLKNNFTYMHITTVLSLHFAWITNSRNIV